MDRFVSIARIVRTHGIRGEVCADLLTDFPERFASLAQVRILCAGTRHWEELEGYRFHKDRVLLKFRGRERPEEVSELLGAEVQIPERQRLPLPQGTYYDSDLVGCRVLQEGEVKGEVTGVLKLGKGAANLVVENPHGQEFMIPAVREFLTRVDVERGVIEVKLPPGLAELAVQKGTGKRKRKR